MIKSETLRILRTLKDHAHHYSLLIQDYKGTQNPEKCEFPFKFRGKEYNSCTTDADPYEKHWCAVEVDENGNSEGKRWGHCEVSRTVGMKHERVFMRKGLNRERH